MRKFTTKRKFLCAASVFALAGFIPNMTIPSEVAAAADAPLNKSWLQKRRADQMSSSGGLQAFHGFQFRDSAADSGIRFQNRAVEDCNKHYKAVHYDHGNGIAVADVDGDGHLDIYFVSQLGSNQLWRGLGNGKFKDATANSGLALTDHVCVTASFADIDNDGDPDLFVTTVRHGNFLFENVGNGRFRNSTENAGLTYSGHSSGAVFFDFDNDGLMDLFLVNVGRYTTEQRGPGSYYIAMEDAFKGHLFPERTERSILYKNIGGGKFKDVTKEMGLQEFGWSGDAAVADLNQDGFQDLYVLSMQGDNHYYENQHGKRFVDRTAAVFPKTPWGAMGIKFFDFNQDGLIDLFVTDMHSDMTQLQIKGTKADFRAAPEKQKSEGLCIVEWTDAYLQGASNNIFGNAFFLNQGQGRFAEVSDKIGAETLWPWGLSVGDINADGYEDAFVTAGMGYNFRYAINSLLLNERGQKFVDSEFVLGIEPRADGRLDKFAFSLDCSGKDKGHPLCEGDNRTVRFRETLSSRSSVIFDIDEDGDLDIVTNEMNDRPLVLVSNLSKAKAIHFLKIKLVGTKSNRDGLGAMVKVHAGDRTLTQVRDGKSGYLSQSSMPLYFGLGDAVKVDSVEVAWPSGKRQSVTQNLGTNRLLTITEEQ